MLGAAQPVGSAILRRKSPDAFVVSFVAAGGGVEHAGFKLVGTQYVSASGRMFDSLTVRGKEFTWSDLKTYCPKPAGAL